MMQNYNNHDAGANITQPETESAPAPEKDALQVLKEKYGRVYRIGVKVAEDDDTYKELTYTFRRPTTPSYDRYLKNSSKVGMSQASKDFALDCVTDEDRAAFAADVEEFPGIALSISNKLTDMLGLNDSVNLRKL
jgi:Protein of unknown function (DUF2765).